MTREETIWKEEKRGFSFLFRRLWGDERGDRYVCDVAWNKAPDELHGFAWMPIKADWRDFVLWCLANFPYEEVTELCESGQTKN